MLLRTAPLLLWSIMVASVPAAAQTSPASSSLTIHSTPPGVSFRITGDQEVSGRAPATLDSWLPGRYHVEGFARGYGGWRRNILCDGMTSDTLWIALRPLSRVGAGARSLVMPGWGQFYDQHPARGWVFLTGALAAGAGLAVTEQRYRDRQDELEAAAAAIANAQTPAEWASGIALWERVAERVHSAHQARQAFLWAGAGVWGLSTIDALAFVPKPEPVERLGTGLGADRVGRETRFVMTLARVRF